MRWIQAFGFIKACQLELSVPLAGALGPSPPPPPLPWLLDGDHSSHRPDARSSSRFSATNPQRCTHSFGLINITHYKGPHRLVPPENLRMALVAQPQRDAFRSTVQLSLGCPPRLTLAPALPGRLYRFNWVGYFGFSALMQSCDSLHPATNPCLLL